MRRHFDPIIKIIRLYLFSHIFFIFYVFLLEVGREGNETKRNEISNNFSNWTAKIFVFICCDFICRRIWLLSLLIIFWWKNWYFFQKNATHTHLWEKIKPNDDVDKNGKKIHYWTGIDEITIFTLKIRCFEFQNLAICLI